MLIFIFINYIYIFIFTKLICTSDIYIYTFRDLLDIYLDIIYTSDIYMQEHNPKNKYLLQGSGILNTIYLSYIDEYLYIFT